MDNIKSNYKQYNDLEEELKHTVIEQVLDFDVTGRYEFVRCEDCNGPVLGHLKPKCAKLMYDGETLMKFDNYLKRIPGIKELVWAREKRLRDELSS